MLKRIVLSGGDHTVTLKALLPSLTTEPEQAYHEFMGTIVESIRYRDKAITHIVEMLQALDRNLVAQYTRIRPQIVAVVRALAMDLFFQAEAHKLYSDRDTLMYIYCRHPDYSFDDVLLSEILPLTWNGRYYEPPLYP
jgi:hypothetical protein